MKKCFLLLGCVLAFVACTPGTQPVKPLIPSGTTPTTPTQPSQPEQPSQPSQPDALKVDVATGAASDLTAFSATLNGSSAGANATIREVGFEWGPTDQMTYTEQASGTTSFSVQLQDLEPQSTYWYRAYVILQRDNEIKTFYGIWSAARTRICILPGTTARMSKGPATSQPATIRCVSVRKTTAPCG